MKSSDIKTNIFCVINFRFLFLSTEKSAVETFYTTKVQLPLKHKVIYFNNAFLLCVLWIKVINCLYWQSDSPMLVVSSLSYSFALGDCCYFLLFTLFTVNFIQIIDVTDAIDAIGPIEIIEVIGAFENCIFVKQQHLQKDLDSLDSINT